MTSNKLHTIFLTGATGFIGQQLAKSLADKQEFSLRIAPRSLQLPKLDSRITVLPPRTISTETDWHDALKGCDVVIHTAAYVHITGKKESQALEKFREINVAGTLNLAQQAAQLGVKRFIFISSIAIYGEPGFSQNMFSANDLPNPMTPYGISKYEAEQGLQSLSAQTGMEIVIIRPPLVYGADGKGNFLKLMHWVEKGYPLPLKSIKNKRSFVSLNNLVSLIIACLDHPKAANQIFLVSDNNDLSTVDLLQRVGKSMNKPVRLFSIPQTILKWLAIFLGQRMNFQRLCGSLQLDISKTCEMIGWQPENDMDTVLRSAAKEYFRKKQS